jgi:hypothetical protein
MTQEVIKLWCDIAKESKALVHMKYGVWANQRYKTTQDAAWKFASEAAKLWEL